MRFSDLPVNPNLKPTLGQQNIKIIALIAIVSP
jgi:hypothetical protein